MDSTTQVHGRYVTGMVQSVGEISPVFEQKLRDVVAEYGIENPTPEGWYSAEAFVNAVNDVAEDIGTRTVTEAGKTMGQQVPTPPDAESPHDALAAVDQSLQEAHRGGESDRPVGSFTYERIDSSVARVGVTEPYPYPEGISRGSLSGVVQQMAPDPSKVFAEEVETAPTSREKAPEEVAYRIRW